MPQYFGPVAASHRRATRRSAPVAGFHSDAATDDARDVLVDAYQALVDAPDLRGLDAALAWLAGELVRRFGFDRVMVLRPDAHLLKIAETTYSEQPELAREAQDHAAENPVELRPVSLEVEMMRRRRPTLVFPAGDHRAWHPITNQLQTPAYVAAPVEAFGRTVATLHADTYFTGREVDIRDRAAIGAFARVAGGALERALLFEEIASLKAGARANAEQLLAMADAETAHPLGGVDGLAPPPRPSVPAPAGAVSPLTPRENEVLGLMSRGATSQEIARRLVVSVGTVKTHARSILKKLGASTRAEAVARSLELQHRLPPRP